MSEQNKPLLSDEHLIATDDRVRRATLSNLDGLKMVRDHYEANITKDRELIQTLGAERDALLRERDEAVRLLGQITGQVRTLPGNTEIGFDFVMLLKRIDGFLSTQGSNTETTHPSPQSDTLTTPLPLSMTEDEMEEESHKWANAEPPWEGPVERTYARTVFKDGLRYASTHTKTITVDKCVHCGRLRSIPDDANP